MKKVLFGVVVLLCVSSAAHAMISGETTLSNQAGWVDWMVFAPGDAGNPNVGLWTYLYQLESNLGTVAAGDGLEILTINAQYVLAGGWIAGQDFDVAWTGGAGIGHEDVAAPIKDPTAITVAPSNSSWFWLGLKVNDGEESSTLWLTSRYGPGSVRVEAQDTISGSGRIPAPIPGPAAALLVFVGLGLIGWFRRRFA